MSNKTIRDKDYLYLSALISAREVNMLNREKTERMLSAGSFGDAVKVLIECGYEDMSGMSASQVEDALARRRAAVFDDISRSIPETALTDAFRLKYDYHNAKVLIKAQGVGTDGGYLISASGRVNPDTMKNALLTEDYRFLPVDLAHAIAEAAGILARTSNPQLADFALDKAYLAEFKKLAGSVNCSLLKDYAVFLTDSANLRAGVRTLRIGQSPEFLKQALINGGTVSIERIIAAASSADSLTALFNSPPLDRAAALGAAAAGGGSLTDFELACDNAAVVFLSRAKLKGFGAEKVIVYFAAVENEVMTARMILTGRLSGIKPEVIRERLRDSYA